MTILEGSIHCKFSGPVSYGFRKLHFIVKTASRITMIYNAAPHNTAITRKCQAFVETGAASNAQ